MLGSDDFDRDRQTAPTNIFETQRRHTCSTCFFGITMFRIIPSFGICEAD